VFLLLSTRRIEEISSPDDPNRKKKGMFLGRTVGAGLRIRGSVKGATGEGREVKKKTDIDRGKDEGGCQGDKMFTKTRKTKKNKPN